MFKMVEHCPKCGAKYAKYPLKDEHGKFIIKNFFKMDWYTIMWLIVVLLLIFGYYRDTSECRKIIEKPLSYCDSINACEVLDNIQLTPEAKTNFSFYQGDIE